MRPRLRLLAVLIFSAVLASACSTSVALSAPTAEPDATAPTATAEPAEPRVVSEPLTPELADAVRNYLTTWYASLAAEHIIVEGVAPLGASQCRIVATHPSDPRSALPVVVLADGEFRVRDNHTTVDVLDPCFYDVGLEPTADDVAVVAAAMVTSLISLRPSDGLPSEAFPDVTERVDDLPIDLENYAGPIIVDVDGVPTSYFLGEDRVANWYVGITPLPPGTIETTVAVIYVG